MLILNVILNYSNILEILHCNVIGKLNKFRSTVIAGNKEKSIFYDMKVETIFTKVSQI